MDLDGCPLPDDLLYDAELEVWARPLAGERSFRVGLVASFASFAGKFLAARFRPIEGSLDRGQSIATVESLRLTQAVRLPAAGTVAARNRALESRPKLMNDDPYGEGWVVDLHLPPGARPPPTLRPASEVADLFRAQILERHVHCYPAVPDVEIYEIGSECSAVLAHLDDEIARRAVNDVVLLVADDPTAPLELERWRMRTGHDVLGRWQEEGLLRFLVRKRS